MPTAESRSVYWPNLLAILALIGEQRVAKRLPDRNALPRQAHGAAIAAGGLSVWLLVHRWLCAAGGTSYVTMTWAVLALVLFACGIFFREPAYRWTGLGVPAAAIGHAFLFDVWKFGPIYRIPSFLALGIVLLVLGFIYNKYEEEIREWL